MNNSSPPNPLIILLFLIVGLSLGFGIGHDFGRNAHKREAIRNGVARWVTTTYEDGSATTKFEWIVPDEKKEK